VWSKEGCTTVNITDTSVVCECNHLTHFAILLSPNLNVSQYNQVYKGNDPLPNDPSSPNIAHWYCTCSGIAGHRLCGRVHLSGLHGTNHCGTPGSQVSCPMLGDKITG
jgi:hypothetical protein